MKPWLALPAHLAYKFAPYALKAHTLFSPRVSYEWQSFTWKGLHFHNPLGTSGGLDKNAEHIEDWWHYGVGFQELGTVTPQPQAPNPGKIMGRQNQRKAVWNRMGFPNQGLPGFLNNINSIRRPFHSPLFINIGKNRWTPNEKAYEDYVQCLEALFHWADVFVVNISSPNTKGLRDLLQPSNLKAFLQPIIAKNLELAGGSPPKPLLLKLSPDQSTDELKATLDISSQLGLNGWILTNTTNQLGSQFPFPKGGGISGEPLADISKTLLKTASAHLGSSKNEFLLVSSGGVLNADDVHERLNLGADLVQIYSALIFEGPQFFRTVANSSTKR